MTAADDKPQPSAIGRLINLTVKTLRAGLTPSLVSYFFWNCAISLIFGGWVYGSSASLFTYLCNIPAQFNATTGAGVGCSNCTDALLLCDKEDCWRHAFNFTYQTEAKVANDPFYTALQQAVLDTNCNQLAQSSSDTVDMLYSIKSMRSTSKGASPTDACIRLHCEIFVNAVSRSKGTTLTGPGTCTNILDIKPADQATTCTCDALDVDLQVASDVAGICGPLASGLSAVIFGRMLGSKDQCFQDSLATQKTAKQYATLSTNINCTGLFKTSDSVIAWFSEKDAIDSQKYSNWAIPPACLTVMCGAVAESFKMSSCNWTTSPNLNATEKGDLDLVITQCASSNVKPQITLALACSSPNLKALPACTSRRLDEDDLSLYGIELAEKESSAEKTDETVEPCSADSGESGKCILPTISQENQQFDHDSLQRAALVFSEVKGYEADDYEDIVSGRILQTSSESSTATAPSPSSTASTASTDNTQLQDYTTTAWSKCTCYQQCISGVSTRSVTCPDGVKCQEPKPSSALACTCSNCSNCNVQYLIWGLAAAYGWNGFVALLLWLAFLGVSTYEEDDYTDMGCCVKLLGCVCKSLPFFCKVNTYIIFFGTCYLIFQGLIPVSLNSDCKFPGMQFLTIGGIVVWVLQLSVGVYMHRFKPMPPWLHTASSSKLFKPINAVGP